MGYTIFLGILGLIALAVLTSGFLSKSTFKGEYGHEYSVRKILLGVGAGFVVLFAGFLIGGSMENVNARTVGIVTEFGKATGTLSPGLNWIAPWADVTEFPTSNQALDLDSTDNTDESKVNPVVVKFNGGGEGAVNVNITWQVQNDDKAVQLWQNWKEFDEVKAKVVNPRGQAAVVEVFGGLRPEDAVNGNRLEEYNKSIQTKLNAALASSGITVENVAIKRVDVSEKLQQRIDKQNEAIADQTTAKTEQETAKIEADTNAIKQKQLTPFTLMDKCLDVTKTWSIQNNGPIPAAGICGGLSNQIFTLGLK